MSTNLYQNILGKLLKSHQEFIHDSIVELLNTLASILLCMLEHIHTEHIFNDLHTEHVFNDLQ